MPLCVCCGEKNKGPVIPTVIMMKPFLEVPEEWETPDPEPIDLDRAAFRSYYAYVKPKVRLEDVD